MKYYDDSSLEEYKVIKDEEVLQYILDRLAGDTIVFVVCSIMVRYGLDMANILLIKKSDVSFVENTLVIGNTIYPIPDGCDEAIQELYGMCPEENNPYLFCSKINKGPVNRTGLCNKISNMLGSIGIKATSKLFKRTYVYMYLKKYGTVEGANIPFQRNKQRLLAYLGISEEEYSYLSVKESSDTMFVKTLEQMYSHALKLRESDCDSVTQKECSTFLEECEQLIRKYYGTLM